MDSEVHEVVEEPVIGIARCAKHGPVVKAVGGCYLFQRPAKVREIEGSSSADRRQLVVVEKDDPAGLDQATEIEQIDKDSVEAVIAIDEGEVELGSLGGKARQDDLRADGMMLN